MTDTTTDPFSLTAEQAGTALAEMKKAYDGPPPSATPKDASEARARLAAVAADEAWRNKYFSGDQAVRKELAEINALIAAGDPVDAVMAGVAPEEVAVGTVNKATLSQMASAVPALREAGLPDDMIAAVLRDEPTDAATFADARMARREMDGSEVFRQRYLSGDREAKQLSLGVNATLVAGVKS
jgi:hypothetical protein